MRPPSHPHYLSISHHKLPILYASSWNSYSTPSAIINTLQLNGRYVTRQPNNKCSVTGWTVSLHAVIPTERTAEDKTLRQQGRSCCSQIFKNNVLRRLNANMQRSVVCRFRRCGIPHVFSCLNLPHFIVISPAIS